MQPRVTTHTRVDGEVIEVRWTVTYWDGGITVLSTGEDYVWDSVDIEDVPDGVLDQLVEKLWDGIERRQEEIEDFERFVTFLIHESE